MYSDLLSALNCSEAGLSVNVLIEINTYPKLYVRRYIVQSMCEYFYTENVPRPSASGCTSFLQVGHGAFHHFYLVLKTKAYILNSKDPEPLPL